MIMLRLRRTGKTKEPTFRVIVSDRRQDTVGTYLESLGSYNPRTSPPTISLNTDRIRYWLSQGAQVSDTLHNLFVDQGILAQPKRKVGGTRKEQPAETTQPTVAAPATEPAAAPETKAP